jgi:hypothetical protein
VDATSHSNAWAVGWYKSTTLGKLRTLTERWNGTAWKLRKSPNKNTNANGFQGVDAISASNAWAVGFYTKGSKTQTLAEHWNGTAWKM